jgi:hypothetical protein
VDLEQEHCGLYVQELNDLPVSVGETSKEGDRNESRGVFLPLSLLEAKEVSPSRTIFKLQEMEITG